MQGLTPFGRRYLSVNFPISFHRLSSFGHCETGSPPVSLASTLHEQSRFRPISALKI
jgi:hypothetical protein